MGMELAVTAAAASITQSVIGGYQSYQQSKSAIDYSKKMQQYNIQEEARKQKQIARAERQQMEDLSRAQRRETGQLLAAQGASGLSMNEGTPLDLFIENQVLNQIEASRLQDQFNLQRDNLVSNLQNANYALEVQKSQAQAAKQNALINLGVTVGLGAAGAGLGSSIGQSYGLTGAQGAALGVMASQGMGGTPQMYNMMRQENLGGGTQMATSGGIQ